MKVWAVTMVRDEADVIGHTIRQLLYQGVDGIIVADNLSTDGTRDVLESWRSLGNVRIVEDKEVAYYQGKKMTALAAKAAAKGATWIIPFDGDELWYTDGSHTIAEILRKQPKEAEIIRVQRWDHVCTPADDAAIENPFSRMLYRKKHIVPRGKVLFRYRPDFEIRQGNHGIMIGRQTQAASPSIGVKIRHFPARSFEQFTRKIENGYRAYRATNIPPGMGGLWRRQGEVLAKEGLDGLRREFEHHYFRQTNAAKYSPAPYLTDALQDDAEEVAA